MSIIIIHWLRDYVRALSQRFDKPKKSLKHIPIGCMCGYGVLCITDFAYVYREKGLGKREKMGKKVFYYCIIP